MSVLGSTPSNYDSIGAALRLMNFGILYERSMERSVFLVGGNNMRDGMLDQRNGTERIGSICVCEG